MLLHQPLPSPGQRIRYTGLHGSSDALALAQLATQTRPLVILTETAWQAQRLRDEIAVLCPATRGASAAGLGNPALRPVLPAPGPGFRTPRHALPDQPQRLRRGHRAGHHRALPPAAARVPGRPHLFPQTGRTLDLDALRQQLTLAGYTHVTQVLTPGEYSVRGGLVDLFPMGSAVPYRLDLFDQEIESIRTFDVDTQRSIYPVKDVRLLPAREFPLDEAGISLFRQNFREKFEGDPSKSQLYKDVSNGLAPWASSITCRCFSTTPPRCSTTCRTMPCFACTTTSKARRSSSGSTPARAYRLLNGDRNRPLLPPEELFLAVDTFFGAIRPFPRIEIRSDDEISRP